MMKMKRFILLAILALISVGFVSAQAQSLVLDFVDGDTLSVVFPDSSTYEYSTGSILEGDSVPVGSIIKTGPKTSAEFKLKPNGTLVKIAANTTFQINNLASSKTEKNAFALVSGKVRTVATKGAQYSVSTRSTVAGVRGTDFTMSYEEGKKSKLLVSKGSVEFSKVDAPDMPIMVGAGQTADGFAPDFAAKDFSPEEFQEEYGDVEVPESRIPEQAEPVAETDENVEESTSPTGTVSDETPSEGDSSGSGSKGLGSKENKVANEILEWLSDVMGMQIGSVTIDGQTYAKAVLQPEFSFGKVDLGLYLPIIYTDNLFDASTWYKPNGNNEWDFGFNEDGFLTTATDDARKSDLLNGALDLTKDLVLKVKYFEFGEPLEDDFFIKVGSLDSFTVGHGLLMRNYSNAVDFPGVRNVGLNIGLDLGGFGFEAMTSDIVDNEIVGGRLYARAIKDSPFAIGVSGIVDRNPGKNLSASEKALYGNPMFIGAAIDFDLPFIKSDLLTVRMFADFANMLPWTTTATTKADGTTVIPAEAQFDMVWLGFGSGKGLTNWGTSAGFMGNVLFVDWRLEYRYYTGAFTPQFFGSSYERSRSARAKEWGQLIRGETSIANTVNTMGVYGEAGASILKDKLVFNFGYFWPWSTEISNIADQFIKADDYIVAKLDVKKGLIPVIDIAGSIVYEKYHFIGDIIENKFSLFDDDTVFSGELVTPIPGAESLDLAIIVSTTTAKDANGTVLTNADGSVQIQPTITIETRFHF